MNKKKNQLKAAIVSTLFMTSKAIDNTTFQQTNNTSLVNLNQGTGVNYTSQQQLSNLKKYLSPYNSHNKSGHYDTTKHTHEQDIKIKAQNHNLSKYTNSYSDITVNNNTENIKNLQSKLEAAYNKLMKIPDNASILLGANPMYTMFLKKRNGEYQLEINIKEENSKDLDGLRDIWHWTCYHAFHFAIVELGFDKIDWLSFKSIALVITKRILEKVFTGIVPGIIVGFLWKEVVHKHVGSFAQHASNRMCGTSYSNAKANSKTNKHLTDNRMLKKDRKNKNFKLTNR